MIEPTEKELEGAKYVDVVMKYMGPELGYVELNANDPEAKAYLQEQLLLNINRKKRRK